MPYRDLTGHTFERLTVLYVIGRRRSNLVWRCKCDCGATVEAITTDLNRGHAQSCGCLHKEQLSKIRFKHGHNKSNEAMSPTYRSWHAMLQRCTYPKHISYKNYGSRGITVCQEWLDFSQFLKDMGERPEGTSIDRINNDLGYSPDNCRWATPKEQVGNQRKRKCLIS